MKVLMLAPQPFIEPRGTPISVYQRARGLAALGHQVDLVTYHPGHPVSIPGVTHYRAAGLPWIRRVKVGPSPAKLVLDALLLLRALGLLLARRYDVIHTHEEAAFAALLLAPLFHTRHLYDMHSSLPQQLANFNVGNYLPIVGLFRVLERLVIRRCDALITIGADLERYAREINPRVPHVMIENQGIDVPADPARVAALVGELALAGRLVVVYTGTFERYQGIEVLVASMGHLVTDVPEAVLVLVGGKPEQVAAIRGLAARAGVADHVRLVGTVPLDEVANYMSLADILVSPRTSGTSVPLKIYSYLHSGTPIVATRIPAHTLVLDDTIAMLAEPTPETLAGALQHLARRPELRAELGWRARQVAQQHHSQEQYQQKLAWIYQALARAQPTESQGARAIQPGTPRAPQE